MPGSTTWDCSPVVLRLWEPMGWEHVQPSNWEGADSLRFRFNDYQIHVLCLKRVSLTSFHFIEKKFVSVH